MKTQFGNILLRRRKELGFTQEYIAKALHLSAQAISKWERGETMPDILLLPALADLLQTSTDELLGHHRQYGKTVYADRYQADEFYWGLEPNEMCYDILRLKPPSQRRLVLDMGCGEGKDAVFLARCGYRAVGFDLAAESIAKAKWLASIRRRRQNSSGPTCWSMCRSRNMIYCLQAACCTIFRRSGEAPSCRSTSAAAGPAACAP